MKTYRLAALLLGLMLLSCSKSEDGPIDTPENPGVDSDYSILVSNNGTLNSMGFDANALDIAPGGNEYEVIQSANNTLFYRKGNSFSFLNTLPSCNAEIQYWEPEGTVNSIPEVFPEDNCDREIIGIAHLENAAFIIYSTPGSGMKERDYFIRGLALDSGEMVFADITLAQQPLQLVSSGDKLYVLSFDNLSGKNSLQVLDSGTGLQEMMSDLGTGVVKILTTTAGHILVSYEGRHLVLESGTLEVLSRVQYLSGKEPHFADAESHYFDPSGILYYTMPTNSDNSTTDHIPAIYDFSKYTAYLYYFENFLSEARMAEYDIGDTSAVAFDHNNGLLLIGYEKANAAGKGGLLRVKPVPEPKFIDQTDLDGVPLYLWAE